MHLNKNIPENVPKNKSHPTLCFLNNLSLIVPREIKVPHTVLLNKKNSANCAP